LQYCSLGRLAHEVGWKHKSVVETLEARRKAKSQLRYLQKKKEEKIREEAKKSLGKKLEPLQNVIKSYGYNV